MRILYDFTPDLIVLDLRMPTMDGWAFLEELKKEGHRVASPIIVLSAEKPLDPRYATIAYSNVMSSQKILDFVEDLQSVAWLILVDKTAQIREASDGSLTLTGWQEISCLTLVT